LGFQIGKNKGFVTSHLFGVAFHDTQVSAYHRGKVDFVDDQEVGLGNSWASFSGNFVSSRYINHVDG